jgi:hypothetical protein
MQFLIGIENNVEGRSMGWALENPGCFAYGANGDLALAAMPEAIANYATWIASRNEGVCWLEAREIELNLLDSWDVYSINENYDLAEQGYEVNAWFRHDWKPLSDQNIAQGLKLLSWSRIDLLDAISRLSQEELNADHPGERWSITGILKHVGMAERWYMHRLGLVSHSDRLPQEPLERLEVVRARLVEVLPTLAGSRQVVGVDGEFWSPRKVLRRAVWHERDHTVHILKVRGAA